MVRHKSRGEKWNRLSITKTKKSVLWIMALMCWKHTDSWPQPKKQQQKTKKFRDHKKDNPKLINIFHKKVIKVTWAKLKGPWIWHGKPGMHLSANGCTRGTWCQKPRKKGYTHYLNYEDNSESQKTRNTSLTFSKMNLWYRINLVYHILRGGGGTRPSLWTMKVKPRIMSKGQLISFNRALENVVSTFRKINLQYKRKLVHIKLLYPVLES